MKKIKVKRLAYYNLITNDILWGAEEYDGNLTDENILDSVHELGKTEWRPTNWIGPGNKWKNELWLLKPDPNNSNVKYPTCRICVETFYRYEKSWYNLLFDSIKRILRI